VSLPTRRIATFRLSIENLTNWGSGPLLSPKDYYKLEIEDGGHSRGEVHITALSAFRPGSLQFIRGPCSTAVPRDLRPPRVRSAKRSQRVHALTARPVPPDLRPAFSRPRLDRKISPPASRGRSALTAALSAVRRVRVIFRPGPPRVSVQPVVGPRKVSKIRGSTAGLTAANRRLNFKLKFNLALTAADRRPRVYPLRPPPVRRPPAKWRPPPAGLSALSRPGPRTPDRDRPYRADRRFRDLTAAGPRRSTPSSTLVRLEFTPPAGPRPRLPAAPAPLTGGPAVLQGPLL